MLKPRQIGFSDTAVLNKIDLVGPGHVEVAKEWIDHHIHRRRGIDATRCDGPLEVLLPVENGSERQGIGRIGASQGTPGREFHG